MNAAAEQLYYAIAQWEKAGSITITSISLPFFQRVILNVPGGSLLAKTLKVGKVNVIDYAAILLATKVYADDFLAFNQKYTPASGALSEQYDRNTGVQTSANDLTWSYASELTAFNARAGVFPPSWGAKGLKVPSGTCVANPLAKVNITFNLSGCPYSTSFLQRCLNLSHSPLDFLLQVRHWS